jgi:hypothetical protein
MHPQDRATRARPRAAAHSGTDPGAFNSATPAPLHGGVTRTEEHRLLLGLAAHFCETDPPRKLRSCPGCGVRPSGHVEEANPNSNFGTWLQTDRDVTTLGWDVKESPRT